MCIEVGGIASFLQEEKSQTDPNKFCLQITGIRFEIIARKQMGLFLILAKKV